MIYALFGPPGVGKTYIGQLLSRSLSLPFLDADTLIDAEETQLLQSGKYDQIARDKFVKKLVSNVEILISDHGSTQDFILAEAFTKEKNRLEFFHHFPGNVCYIKVEAPLEVAERRTEDRLKLFGHVINAKAFKLIWSEFEEPHLLHMRLVNHNVADDVLIEEFESLLKLIRRGGNI